MKRPGIFERSVRDSLRECLAGRPIPPEFLEPIQIKSPVEQPVPPPPKAAEVLIDFHREGDDDASF